MLTALSCTKPYAKLCTCLMSFKPHHSPGSTNEKTDLSEIKQFVLDYTASSCQNQNQNPGLSGLK